MDAAGRPAAGAHLWTDAPRHGARADERGRFRLDAPEARQLFAAAGNSVAAAPGGAARLRLTRVEALREAERRLVGLAQLEAATRSATLHRRELLGLLGRLDASRARPLVRDDDERAVVLIARAERHLEQAEALFLEAERLSDPFVRARAAQGLALRWHRTSPAHARRAFGTARALWEAGAVGGNALLFDYAALALRLDPQRAEKAIRDAESWAEQAPRPNGERARLALAIAATDPLRARALALRLDAPFAPVALMRLAGQLAKDDPSRAYAFFTEADRLPGPDASFDDARAAALPALLPWLEKNQAQAARRLIPAATLPQREAWRLRLDPALDRAAREAVLEKRLESLSLDDALIAAELVRIGAPPTGPSRLLATLRTRLLTELAAGPLGADEVVRFVSLIASRDPAAARAVLERSWMDAGHRATDQARLAEAMVAVDAHRALQLVDAMENRDWSPVARGRSAYFLALGSAPAPFEPPDG